MQVNARREPARTALSRPEVGICANGSVDDWRRQALCSQTDPELFFPDKGGSAREALGVCAQCPVKAACLDFALEMGEQHGVWGGTTERQRQELRRVRQEASAGGHVPGLTLRGEGKWAVAVRYRSADGKRSQLTTTVTGDLDAALLRLAELRERAAQLAGADLAEVA